MTPRMTLSRAGLDFIKLHEGYRRRAARLPDGRWVVGYSHVKTAREGVEVDAEEAERLLMYDLKPVVAAVNDLVMAPMTQNQFDALVSLAFNIGPRQFRLSGVARHVNAGRPLDAAAGFDVWRRAMIDGEAYIVDALVRRRAAEKAMFLTPEHGPIAAPTSELPVVADPDAVYVAPMDDAVIAEVDLEGDAARVDARMERAANNAAASPAQAAADEIVDRINRIIGADVSAAERPRPRRAERATGSLSAFVGASERGGDRPPQRESVSRSIPHEATGPHASISPQREAELAQAAASAAAATERRRRPAADEPHRAASAERIAPPPRRTAPASQPAEPIEVEVERWTPPAAAAQSGEDDEAGFTWLVGLVGFAVMLASVYGLASLSGAVEPSPWQGVSVAGLCFGVLAVFTSVYMALRRAGELVEE